MRKTDKTVLHIAAHGATQWVGHQASKDRDDNSKALAFIVALVIGLFFSWLIKKV